MSKVSLPVNLCSHLVNTSKASLARTSMPYTNASLAISTLLLRHGLISSVSLGTRSQPSPTDFVSAPEPAKRLWIGLKQRNGIPVLRHMALVSKPSLRIRVNRDELGRLLTGKRAKNIPGVGMGELLILRLPKDRRSEQSEKNIYMEGWEAWRAGRGGEVVCRVG